MNHVDVNWKNTANIRYKPFSPFERYQLHPVIHFGFYFKTRHHLEHMLKVGI